MWANQLSCSQKSNLEKLAFSVGHPLTSFVCSWNHILFFSFFSNIHSGNVSRKRYTLNLTGAGSKAKTYDDLVESSKTLKLGPISSNVKRRWLQLVNARKRKMAQTCKWIPKNSCYWKLLLEKRYSQPPEFTAAAKKASGKLKKTQFL